jgi:hypothetical protein
MAAVDCAWSDPVTDLESVAKSETGAADATYGDHGQEQRE